MVSTWGTVCVGIISSLSALIACWMANSAAEARMNKQLEIERQKDWHQVRISKAEEVYASLLKYKNFVFNTHMDWIALASGEQTLESIIQNIKNRPENDADMMMARLGVYFPKLLPDFKQAKEINKPANQCYFLLSEGKDIDDDKRKEMLRTIFHVDEEFCAAMDGLLVKLSREVAQV
ncbi:hypothetical protein C1Y41_05795 [Pantoea sp. ICBG 1758]|uniref:hypothetical protein n=1 Tax=Pantoea sp. ICBG 1758 TaxID=2071682 RepID=UPI000CE43EF0|nr:hypothetical protein [Pantoea sp. ICBG 1758]PPC64149.1 hypothetical protein C1Y41_05795 [Pantoea sp. ICBG 1758]